MLSAFPSQGPRRARGTLAAALASILVLVAALLVVGGSQPSGATAAVQPAAERSSPNPRHDGSAKPTVVLVHGAFADASGWSAVIRRLQARGYPVLAPANPLRGLTSDSEYLETVLATIPGPIVLVGHSYGGAVITNAAKDNSNVIGLVYIAAFALDEGESVEQASALAGGSNDLLAHIIGRPFGSGPTDVDAYIDPAYFHELFAQDLPTRLTDVMAVSQRPAALLTLGEPSGPPAWEDIPSWYLVAKNDHTIPPVAERFMAERAGAHTTEIRSSHVAMISHPGVVVSMIRDAAH
ncbi:MAG TPA: alpha/beta hydrolase [Nocardioides sp.]|nr:alpha/beta hydrolase [Nocardioides sp.]HRK46420.1 alpha/beta hydrolase [Nocardioides sp.]